MLGWTRSKGGQKVVNHIHLCMLNSHPPNTVGDSLLARLETFSLGTAANGGPADPWGNKWACQGDNKLDSMDGSKPFNQRACWVSNFPKFERTGNVPAFFNYFLFLRTGSLMLTRQLHL